MIGAEWWLLVLPGRLVTSERQTPAPTKGFVSASWRSGVAISSHFTLFWQDSAGDAEENIEKVVNLELVFGYHLKPGNGPKVSWACWISLAIFLVTTQGVPFLLDAKKLPAARGFLCWNMLN